MKKFNKCLDNEETKKIIEENLQIGKKAGVSGTPAFFIGNEMIVGAQPFSVFENAIEKELLNKNSSS